jgi:microcompartments protein
MDSYGYIETYGYVAAITAADEGLKAANVTLKNRYFVKGGIVTIEFSGDVAAVIAAVDAGVEVAKRMGAFLTSNVIARVDNETKKILVNIESPKGNNPNDKNPSEIEGKSEVEEKTEENLILKNELEEISEIENVEEDLNLNDDFEKKLEIENTEENSNTEEIQEESKLIEENETEQKLIENVDQKLLSENRIEKIEYSEHEEKNLDSKNKIEDLKKKYQKMKVSELKEKVEKLKLDYSPSQIKGMTKKKLINVLIEQFS